MGQRYLIDSNVIIDYTSGNLPLKASDFTEQIFDTDFFDFGGRKIEVFGFDDIPAKINAMEEFIDTAYVMHLDDKIIQQTILLRRQYKKLKLGDAIIAATPIIFGLTLVTRNVADFKNINNLQILNPWNDI